MTKVLRITITGAYEKIRDHRHHHYAGITIMPNLMFIFHAWGRQVYLIANIHFILSFGTSCCIFNILRSPYITSSQAFRCLPHPLCPMRQYPWTSLPNCRCPFSQHVQTTLFYPICMQFVMLTYPTRSLTSSEDFLSFTSTVP